MFVANVAILTALAIGNNIVFDPSLEAGITGMLCPPEIFDTSVNNTGRNAGQELANDIQKEGSVLLKNNGVLPLSKDTVAKVNVFGYGSIDWVHGGSGSGQVMAEQNDDTLYIDILDALKEYGVEYNQQIIDMYHNFASPRGDTHSIQTSASNFYKLTEPSINDKSRYSDALLNAAKDYSNTAFVVIGRRVGETEDPTRYQNKVNAKQDATRHYLEISTEEEDLLTYVGQNYENVIVLVNSCNIMELTFMDTIKGLDACLLLGGTGTQAARVIPSILYGEVSPSGRLVDTFAYEMESNPSYYRSGASGKGYYTNASELYPTGKSSNASSGARKAPSFVDYIEGIYVGYKWYETADAEGVWNNSKYTRTILDNNDSEYFVNGYDSVVQYPFGYGLSYTNFDWTIESVSLENGSSITEKSKIDIKVRVTNTGEMAGKEVVQVYMTPEYKDGGIEKSHVNLVGFGKTNLIQPGKNEVITITVDAYDFLSYDCYDMNENNNTGYELEKGNYQLKLMNNSHEINKVDFVGGSNDVDGLLTYKVDDTINVKKDRYSNANVDNKLTNDDENGFASVDGKNSGQDINYISRSQFPDPYSIGNVSDRTLADNGKVFNLYSQQLKDEWDNATTDVFGNPTHNEPVTWEKPAGALEYNGISYANDVVSGYAKLFSNGKPTSLGLLLGSDYDNELWDPVLDQLKISEVTTLTKSASYGNAALSSVGKPRFTDYDGPNQVRSYNYSYSTHPKRGTGFPNSTVVAQTWSKSLAYSFGLNYGSEMNELAVNGVYGFGVNIHRSPFCGRNHEYYSEDAFLSGVVASEVITGLSNTGKYCYLKHFVCNETETERDSTYTWLTEQTLREVYLRPFQDAIQKGHCVGLMSAYNRVGNIWAGGNERLIQGIVRNEWNFDGMIITDYSDGHMTKLLNIDNAVRAGADTLLGSNDSTLSGSYDATNRSQYQLREVAHHVLYATLNPLYQNSIYNARDDVESIISSAVIESWVWWKPVVYALDIGVIGGCAIWLYFIVKGVFFKDAFKEKESKKEEA